MSTIEHTVIIAGAGPTGLMLAGELALAGVDVAIIERRETQEVAGARAGGLHARTIEILDQRGIAERFLSEGQAGQVTGFAMRHLDISDFPSRHGYGLGLWQSHIETILADWVAELEVPVHRGLEVAGFTQDDTGVDVALGDGDTMRTRYLVGCDGGRSVIRKAAGIDFPGWEPTVSHLIGLVEMTTEPEMGGRQDDIGIHAIGRLDYEIRDGEVVYGDQGPIRVMVTEKEIGSGQPTLDELREGLVTVYGTDFGVHSPTSLTRFTDATRQAASYRDRRVLLAGDAAHIHAPAGGQGLNIGVHDAVNLGWKLAQVVQGDSPESLLDSYHAERHPVAARILRSTMAQTGLMRSGGRLEAAREILSELLDLEEARKYIAGMMSGLDVHYDLGKGHPLLGRRMPDLDLTTANGPLRVYTLLRRARPVFLDFTASGVDLSGWTNRVQRINAEYKGSWELPVLGDVPAPAAVLIRPDGHVAWTGEPSDPTLSEALAAWCGPATGE